MFYEFIDPATSRKTRIITIERAQTLLPWFHEYQMTELVEECDSIFSISWFRSWHMEEYLLVSFWSPGTNEGGRTAELDKCFELISISCIYDLLESRAAAMKHLSYAIKYGYDLFDEKLIKKTLRIEPKENQEIVWGAFKAYLPRRVAKESLDKHHRNKLLPILIHAGIEKKMEENKKKKIQEDLNDLRKEFQGVVTKLPSKLRQALPQRKQVGIPGDSNTIDRLGQSMVKRVMYDTLSPNGRPKPKLHGLIEIPSSYKGDN